MKTITLLTVAMLATPLAAQVPDRGGESRVQVHGEFMRPRQILIPRSGLNDLQDQAENQIGFGIRLLGEIPGTNNWYYTLGGKLESSSKFASKPSSLNDNTDTTGIKYKYSYWTVGAGYMWGLAPGLSLGAHLEVRGESLNAAGDWYTGTSGTPLHVDASSTYVRPWGRLSLDYAFKAAGTSPFIGVDAAVAMLKTDQGNPQPISVWDEKTVKSMAPQASFSVYVGLKF
ncbi:MAG: hypothetical protein KGN80_02970 [Acidobacteriota bacterium]|nr:hypothetical protein [Acidobacteriota bacterium]